MAPLWYPFCKGNQYMIRRIQFKQIFNINKMVKYFLSLFFLFSFGYVAGSDVTPKYFIDGSMTEVMKKAGSEGKLYFVDFYADWCTPCKWMDKTVFSDTKVEKKLTENYIPIKVNIDDIEGFELKQKYKIAVLPTFLIFNSKGELVERVEETLDIRELLDLLNLHDNPDNKVKIQREINVGPGSLEDRLSKKEITQAYKKYIDSETNVQRKYRLQLGLFYDHESAFNKVEALKRTFLEPIIVLNDIKNEEVRFKVLMGEFETLEEAKGFQHILTDQFSIQSIIN